VSVPYWIAALLVLFSFPANGQTQAPNTGGNATTHTISAGATAADVCSGADKGEAGHFAALYPWYVHAIQSKVREKWLMNEVDPHAPSASRVCLNFDINRVGEPSNVRIVQSSGLPSLDESALRAVSRVSSFGPLPPDWERDKVSVFFWFDYKPKARECTAEDYLKSSGSKGENGLRVWPEEGLKVSLGSNQMFRVIGTSLVTIPSWSVEGEQCKANDCGSVSVMGLYSAPRTMPPNPEIALKVQEKAQPCRIGTTRLTLIPEAGR
jgi:TonB family protein